MNENKMSDKDKHEQMALQAFFSRLGFDYSKEKEWKDSNEWKEFRRLIRRSIRKLKEIEELERKLIESRKLIIEEAKKRNCDISELIDNFINHPEELLELLEKKGIKPKFKKIYTHSDLLNLQQILFKTQKLNDKGISTIKEDFITGEAKVWESEGVEYIIKVGDLPKLNGKKPKVYVSQIKNLSLLMGITQEQQFNNSIKEAKCEFTLSYYAERRGYTKEQIKEGGKFFNELKRDLLTGAYTTYRVDRVIIEGKEYIAHGIPNFYTLYEPKDHGNEWRVIFNNPYSKLILEILNGKAKQYFVEDRKAVEDRATTNKPYLFLFYMQLIKRKRANLSTTPVKIGNLLTDMKLDEQILTRPKECFNLLKECLIYFSEHYQPTPEIEQFFLYNDFHKTETVKLPLHISEAFKQYGYNDFKGLLKAIGIKDIREAFISFKRPYSKPKKSKLNAEEERLLIRTLKWFEGKITKIPLKDQEGLIKRYIKKYGVDYYEDLFEREANKNKPNAIEFLTKVLKDPEGYYKSQNSS